jgi:hypothetical protein
VIEPLVAQSKVPGVAALRPAPAVVGGHTELGVERFGLGPHCDDDADLFDTIGTWAREAA